MPKLAIVIGAALVALGLVGYFGSESRSGTALIPSAIGVLLAASGVVGLKPAMLKHAMHFAALITLLGLLGAWGRLIPAFIEGKLPKPLAVTSQLLTGLLCFAFVVLAIKSFIDARRARANERAAD